MANINSFAENVAALVENTNDSIKLLQGFNEAMVSNKEAVSLNLTVDGSTQSYSLPSWNSMNTKLNAASNSVASLLKGQGIVSLGDGTGRTVKLSDVAEVPAKITGLKDPSTFSIDANWWFEDMMYPCAQITLDLRGKIDDTANRVLVDRIILKASDYMATYQSEIANNKRSYNDFIAYLNDSQIRYTEDKEEVILPLNSARYEGTFHVTGISYVSTQQWLTLDTINYSEINQNTGTAIKVNKLEKGDQLASGSFLYVIEEVSSTGNKIRVQDTLGYSVPDLTTVFNYYNEPWQNKYVNVKFGYDEINIVYFKGINKEFNLVANDWSDPVQFSADDLVFSDDGSTKFSDYYLANIADFGQKWIDEINEKKISFTSGVTPNVPKISASDFSVVQINTQINAALDTDSIKSLSAENESTKSTISSLKGTIESQQTELQSLTGTDYSNMLTSINSNITELQGLETKYKTSLSQLQTLLQENDGIVYTPKYHIRGFFSIPANSVLADGTVQAIVGFEVEYRYIKQDSTGTSLKTFSFTDSTGATHTGVYSDWNIVNTPVLEKTFNSETQKYEWQTESISDGTAINTNQIDIPISKGEKVEFKIRSVSEAGYPYSPLKSDWSSSVIMEFPDNLSTSSEVQNLIDDINNENTLLTVENAFTTHGVDVHMNDSQANTNSVTNTYYKHRSENLAYEMTDLYSNQTSTSDVQTSIDMLFKFVKGFLQVLDPSTSFDNFTDALNFLYKQKK